MPNLSTVRTREHAEALQQRDRFLDTHPELRDLQRTIDEKLRSAASDHNRLVLIHKLMMDAFRELNVRLQSLVGSHRRPRH